jgi:hypothetical protein
MSVLHTLVLHLDLDPRETSWQIIDTRDDIVIERKSGFYQNKCQAEHHTFKLGYNQTFTFTISDSFGDGMSFLCGQHPGNYSMYQGENLLFAESGLSFEKSKSHSFLSTGALELAPSPDPSQQPTSTPSNEPSLSREPTSKPSQQPSKLSIITKPPTNRPIADRQEDQYVLEINTDQFPRDISWKIVHTTYQSETIHYIPQGHYTRTCNKETHSFTLVEGHEYAFSMEDRFGDGMKMTCAGSPSNYSLYKVLDAGDNNALSPLFMGTGDSFTRSVLHEFIAGDPTPIPTLSPTLSKGFLTSAPSLKIQRNADSWSSAVIAVSAVFGTLLVMLCMIFVKMTRMRRKGAPVY